MEEKKQLIQKAVDAAWPSAQAVVGEVLGNGGQAVVYELALPDRKEALKVIDTSVYGNDLFRRRDANRRARSEIHYHRQASAQTDAVVKFYDAAEFALGEEEKGQDSRKQLFLIRMELLTPIDPDRIAALQPPSREAAALAILKDVLQGITALEKAGIVHRDVKLLNTLQRRQAGAQRFIVSDFGLARPFTTRPDHRPVTLCGSSDHIAPELLRHGRLVAARSDVFSAGVMLFHLLWPEGGSFDPAVFPSRKAAFPCGEDLWALLCGMTRPDPAKRLSPASALVQAQRLLMLRDPGFGRSTRQTIVSSLARSFPPDPALLAALPDGEAACLLRAGAALLANDRQKAVKELVRGANAPENSGAALYYLGQMTSPASRTKAAALLRLAARHGWQPARQALQGQKPDSAQALREFLLTG